MMIAKWISLKGANKIIELVLICKSGPMMHRLLLRKRVRTIYASDNYQLYDD